MGWMRRSSPTVRGIVGPGSLFAYVGVSNRFKLLTFIVDGVCSHDALSGWSGSLLGRVVMSREMPQGLIVKAQGDR